MAVGRLPLGAQRARRALVDRGPLSGRRRRPGRSPRRPSPPRAEHGEVRGAGPSTHRRHGGEPLPVLFGVQLGLRSARRRQLAAQLGGDAGGFRLARQHSSGIITAAGLWPSCSARARHCKEPYTGSVPTAQPAAMSASTSSVALSGAGGSSMESVVVTSALEQPRCPGAHAVDPRSERFGRDPLVLSSEADIPDPTG